MVSIGVQLWSSYYQSSFPVFVEYLSRYVSLYFSLSFWIIHERFQLDKHAKKFNRFVLFFLENPTKSSFPLEELKYCHRQRPHPYMVTQKIKLWTLWHYFSPSSFNSYSSHFFLFLLCSVKNKTWEKSLSLYWRLWHSKLSITSCIHNSPFWVNMNCFR